MNLNDLYGVRGPLTPDYFDCKMLNDLAAELRQDIHNQLTEARNLRRLIGLCRDAATRYHWMTRMGLILGQIIATRREWHRVQNAAHKTTRAYIEALDRDATREGLRRAA